MDTLIEYERSPLHIAAMMLVPLGEYIKQHPKERDDAE